MNKYVVNTKDYNAVAMRERRIPVDNANNAAESPSCFYDFASPKKIRIRGYSANLDGPDELIDKMRKACENL